MFNLNKKNRFKSVFLLLLISIFTQIYFLSHKEALIYAYENEGSDLGLELLSENKDNFAQNFAPGDSSSKFFKVRNNGNSTFRYSLTTKMETGEPLYNILDLVIVDSDNTVLYKGKLRDASSLNLGYLKPKAETSYTFVTSFPVESGNELQGLRTTYSVIANAEIENEPKGDSNKDPRTQLLPKTGIPSYIPYYSAGLISVIAGLFFWTKKK